MNDADDRRGRRERQREAKAGGIQALDLLAFVSFFEQIMAKSSDLLLDSSFESPELFTVGDNSSEGKACPV